LPPEARRVEVRNVATGELIHSIALPTTRAGIEPTVCIDPTGQYLWISSQRQPVGRYDLRRPGPPAEDSVVDAATAGGDWRATLIFHREDKRNGVTLSFGTPPRPWLHLFDDELSQPRHIGFSPDGNYFAWSNTSGLISVADIRALQRAVDVAEGRHRSD
jgi:hypothetical protein